jgi:hypothetical protein
MNASPHGDKHATVGDRFATSEAAYTILRHLLPTKWIIRHQSPDFHIDYLIEPTEAGELTGINIAVQLKGWTPAQKKANNPAYSLKTKHLVYYLQKCELPVILVLIDVTNRRGYWAFMQQFGHSLSPEHLKQKRVLVRFSLENTLDDTPRLTKAILDAVAFMRELRPGSIDAALSHRKKELEAKDNRVEVQVDLVGGRQNIILSAKKEFPFSIQFNTTDSKTIEAIKDFYEKGIDLPIKRCEVEFKGSPLFGELGAKPEEKLTIHHGKDVEGHALFTWGDGGPDSHLFVPGKFRAALKYLTFDGSPPGSPLKLQTSVPWSVAITPQTFSMSIGFQPKEWKNQRIVALPYFETIYRFFNAALTAQRMELRLYVQGNSLGASAIDGHDIQALKPALYLLQTLDRARALAGHFKVDPVLPSLSAPLNRHLEAVDQLHAITFSDEYRQPAPNVKASFKCFGSDSAGALRPEVGPLTVVQPARGYDLFNCPVTLGPVQTQLTELKLVRQIPMKEPGWVELELSGTERSEYVVRHKGVVYEPPSQEFP